MDVMARMRLTMVMMLLVVMLMIVLVRVGCSFEYIDFCAGDSAAIDGIDLQGCGEIHGGGRIVEDERVDSDIDESPEEHVTGDAGETIEIGNAHVGFLKAGILPFDAQG